MIRVDVRTRDLQRLGDPQVMERAEKAILQRGVEIYVPLARAEAPAKSGRGRAAIAGAVYWRTGGTAQGVIHAGKAYWLRILQRGATAHEIAPVRFKSKARARRAARAFGPARERGAIRALRFRLGGGGPWVFRARATHPGLKANRWLERAARAGEGAFVQAAEQILDRALEVTHV